jgi:hypothetical protein
MTATERAFSASVPRRLRAARGSQPCPPHEVPICGRPAAEAGPAEERVNARCGGLRRDAEAGGCLPPAPEDEMRPYFMSLIDLGSAEICVLRRGLV